MATKPSYRAAWRESKHCIIPAAAIYEPDWRTGKSVPTRISRKEAASCRSLGYGSDGRLL
uniref:Uncharacterized protein n=1 Tax=Pseudomonas aeruginosa TaxID=287 RepID=A0A2L1KH31_PSEAI|nr:Hypothetical protein [Pseudomonas aeruginosa]